jgi:outer membrane protein
MPVLSYPDGELMVRMGYANIDFREDANPVLVNDELGIGRLSVESQHSPLLTFGATFREHWGVELLVPWMPMELEVAGKGGLIEGLPIGTADIWPLAATVQYYPFKTRRFKPYVGIGANYTLIKHEKINKNTAALLGIERVESAGADDSFGLVVQVGIDIPVTDRLAINVSTSYMDVELDASALAYVSGIESTLTTQLSLKAQPNFTVVGITYRF